MPPDPSLAAATADHEVRRLLAGFASIGETDLFGQVQRAAGLEPLGLLSFATIGLDALIAALDADFAGVGTLEQTRLLTEPSGYVLEDARFGLRVATGVLPTQETATDVYARFCRRLHFLADILLRDVREGENLFVRTAGAGETPERLLHLHRALARHGGAMLLVVQPSSDPARAGQVEWLAPSVMRGWLMPQTTLEAWVALCRSAEALRGTLSAAAQAPTPVRPTPIRLGICAIVRDEAAYVEEWVAFHRRQGVSEFRIYDNGSVDGTPEILKQLGIDPIIWAGRPDDFVAMQQAAYEEAARALAGTVDWLAFIDVDEFVFGRNRPLAEVLTAFTANVGAIAVQQRLFGSNGLRTWSPGLVVQRFTRCARLDHHESHWFKTIVRPELVVRVDSPHSVVLRGGTYVMVDGSPLRRGDHLAWALGRVEGPIGLHHYLLKSLAEFRVKQARWAGRSPGRIVDDNFFFSHDLFTNEDECKELTNIFGSNSMYIRNENIVHNKDKDLLFVQTSDPVSYRAILELTAPVNIAYCLAQGHKYESYLGIKRGIAPFHATYNRIFILNELISRGHRGWVCYMDADAFVVDFLFNINQYLLDNSQYCLIACTGGSTTPWDINAGVFFLNLADADGCALARDWLARFEMLVPEAYLASHQAKWGDAVPDDQQILYEVLKNNPNLLRRTKKEDDGNLFNYRDGRFIKQATRESFTDAPDRMNWIRNETRAILDKVGIQASASNWA